MTAIEVLLVIPIAILFWAGAGAISAILLRIIWEAWSQ